MKFKDRFKELRMARGLSQVEMAERLGISKSVVGAYETGERTPTFERLLELADYFHVNVDWLVGRDVEQHVTTEM